MSTKILKSIKITDWMNILFELKLYYSSLIVILFFKDETWKKTSPALTSEYFQVA